MFHFAMSTVSMSVCITLTIAVIAHAALNYGTPAPRPFLIYSGAVAAASSVTVIGLALVARLSITQTLMLTMAFAVVLALLCEYAGVDVRVAPVYLAARAAGAGEKYDRVGMVNSVSWAPAAISDSAPERPKEDSDSHTGTLFAYARLPAISYEECELLAGAQREGADLDEVDRALAVLMRLLIHPTLARDPDLTRYLVDFQRRLHARRAVLSMQASGQGDDIGQSAVQAQVQARLARLYSSLREEYSDD